MITGNVDYCSHSFSVSILPLTVLLYEGETVNEMSEVVGWNVGGSITLLRV